MSTSWRHGMIVRAKLTDFMTFDQVEFRPGPKLNLIIGPNGSGKSTFVCALALGLGGQPKVLGRASTLSAFVKTGKERAVIELELFNGLGGSNTVIMRTISSAGNRGNEWRVDGKPVTAEIASESLKYYNIQVDNLTQFLPQDRVGEFSKFNDVQLLRETIRSVSGDDQVAALDTFAQQQKVYIVATKELGIKEKELETLEEENRRTKEEVEQQQERRRLVEDVRLRQNFLPWVRFDETREATKRLKDQEQELAKRIEAGKARLNPLRERAKSAKAAVTGIDRQVALASNRLKQKKIEKGEALEEQKEATDDVVSKLKDIDSITEQNAKLEQDIRDMEKRIASDEGKLTKMPSVEETDQNTERIRSEIVEAKVRERQTANVLKQKAATATKTKIEKSALVRQCDEAKRLLQELNGIDENPPKTTTKMDDPQAARKEAVINRMKSQWRTVARDARNWVNSPNAGFSKSVYGPLACEVVALNAFAGSVLETHVRDTIWAYFVLTDPSDRSVLSKKAFGGGDRHVSNIVIIPGQRSAADGASDGRPRVSIATQQRLGLSGFLDDLVVGPQPVVEALRKLGSIHTVLVGTPETERVLKTAQSGQILEDLMREAGDAFNKKIVIYTPSLRVEVYRSKYGARAAVSNMRKRSERGAGENDINLIEVSKAVLSTPTGASSTTTNRTQEISRRVSEKEKEIATITANVTQANKQLETALEEEKEAKKVYDEADTHLKNLQTELEKGEAQKTTRAKLVHTIKANKVRLENDRKKAAEDQDAAIERLRQELSQAKMNVAKCARRVTDALEHVVKATIETVKLGISRDALVAERDATEQTIKKLEDSSGEEMKLYEDVKKRAAALMEQAKKLKRDAESMTGPLTNELKATFLNLPNTVDELQAEIEVLEAQINSIFENPNAIEQWRKREARIRELTTTNAQTKHSLDAQGSDLLRGIQEWEEPIGNVVNLVAGNFENFFKEISEAGYACAGHVELVKEGEPIATLKNSNGEVSQMHDLSKYGIGISVKFRSDQPLTRMSSMVQSGGERALTTFLFMLALQERITSAFRVVDEINQGMDADKERLALYRLVNQSKLGKLPQYFLITPKLLRNLDLDYTNDVTVLFVFNGRYSLSQDKWDLGRFLERKRLMLQEAQEEKETGRKRICA